MCVTSFSGIAGFPHIKHICVKHHLGQMNNFSTQRRRGSENGNDKNFDNGDRLKNSRETENGKRMNVFSLSPLSVSLPSFFVVVTRKAFAVAVAVL